jgi:type II secretory pathway pseudopilin PulG
MRFSHHCRVTDSFTLVELLVVIGILAILTAAVVIVLNPAELLKQSRDSKRTTDLAAVNNALKLLLTQNPDVSLGNASTVYVSLADASLAAGATSTCPSLGLPALPSGWKYQCVSAANLIKTDGTGWIPVNFASGASQLPALPIDPQNVSSTGLYYTYASANGRWELDFFFESAKRQAAGQNDGGDYDDRYEIGSNVAITPSFSPFSSCQQAKAGNGAAPSGFYAIQSPAYGPMRVYCDMDNDGGGWMLVTPSMVQNVQNSYASTTISADEKGGAIVNVAANPPYDCSVNHNGKMFFSDVVPWTRMRADYEFYGGNACWGIFGDTSSYAGGSSNLIPFSSSDDVIRNQVKMGGSNGDAFDGRITRCDNETSNFWHGNNGQGLRSAQVILRRNSPSAPAGIAQGATCLSSSSRWVHKNIYVK